MGNYISHHRTQKYDEKLHTKFVPSFHLDPLLLQSTTTKRKLCLILSPLANKPTWMPSGSLLTTSCKILSVNCQEGK